MTEQPVNQTISDKDTMFDGTADLASYLKTGKSAAIVCRMAVQLANISPARILDYGSGHGRILRWFQSFFPDADLSAADVATDNVEFCSKQFGARPILMDKHYSRLVFPSSYDLIWLGSIYTHMGREDWDQVTDMLMQYLRPNGLFCFSFAGAFVHDLLIKGDRFALDQEDEPAVRHMLIAYETEGFGFFQRREWNGIQWGRTLARHDWVLGFLKGRGAKIVLFTEQGYGNRQDIVCVQFPTKR